MTTNTNTNNALVHKYLIPLIENIDFSDCDNNSTIKAVINKLMTVAKNTMNTEKEPGDTSGVKIDNMKGATIKDSTDEGASDKDVDKTVNVDKPTKVAFDQSTSKKALKKAAKKPVKTTKVTQKDDTSNESSDSSNNSTNIGLINSDIDEPASDDE